MLIRRSFLIGLASSLAAPAIVHTGNLMPIKPVMVRGIWWSMGFSGNPLCSYGDCGQVSIVNGGLAPLQHFLDMMQLPQNAQWGILN